MDTCRKVGALFVICVILSLIASVSVVFAEDGDVSLSSGSVAIPYVPGEIIVKFRPDVTLEAPAKASAHFRAQVKEEVPQIGVEVVEVPPEDMQAAIEAYLSNPQVEYAEPNFIAELAYDPNDPYYAYGYQWSLRKIEAPLAWDISPGSPEVIVAVVDSGVATDHPDLKDKLVPGYNFVANSEDVSDDLGHGTHVAGVIAAGTDNSIGIASVSFRTRIMPVKVLNSKGYAKYSDVAKGIIYAADHGAKVINLSLGGYASSYYLQAAVNYAWQKGAVVVAAAGNNNTSRPFYPAACANVIAVSATDRNDTKASFSNYGSYISVAAPGVGIYSTYWCRGANYYASMSGTSLATAHVSGVAALLFSQDGTRSNAVVRNLIEGTADDLGDPGWDRYYGHGRVNAYKALRAAEPAPETSIPNREMPMPTPSLD
jgi:thermitase